MVPPSRCRCVAAEPVRLPEPVAIQLLVWRARGELMFQSDLSGDSR